ncbi:MAG TPA: helix-turn-helix transcriptional regulator [Cyclobacteriaceae bacterium]|nr:helix-turn-helix transcriptional regulator [Cyclobacteriaceae bacterium]
MHFHIPQQTEGGIRAVFQTHGFPQFTNETILPKGNTEIIFDLSEVGLIRAAMGGGVPTTLPRCFIISYGRVPIHIQLPRQQTYFGLVLDPVVIYSLLGAPAGEFANQWVDLTLVDKSYHEVWERLAAEETFSARVALITKWMKAKTKPLQAQDHLLNEFLCNHLSKPVSVTEVADRLCYSPRHLSRKLKSITGLNTEEVLLYKKYLRSVHFIHHTQMPLTRVGHESFFTDQSHFIKAFKLFSDMTPGEYGSLKGGGPPHHIFHNVR